MNATLRNVIAPAGRRGDTAARLTPGERHTSTEFDGDPFDCRDQRRITDAQMHRLDTLAAMHAVDLRRVVRAEHNGEVEELTERAADWTIANFAECVDRTPRPVRDELLARIIRQDCQLEVIERTVRDLLADRTHTGTLRDALEMIAEVASGGVRP